MLLPSLGGILGGLLTLSLLGGCPSNVQSLTEATSFLLDECNPSDGSTLTSCSEAATKADEIIAADATSIDGAIFSSSAHLGLARVDFLQVASSLSDLANNSNGSTSDDDFSQFRALVTTIETDNGSAIDLTELESAKTALTTLLAGATVTDSNKRAFFQLGVIQIIDALIRPVKLAGAGAASVSAIDLTEATRINTDFINADNNLVASGTTDSDFLSPIRDNFCRCKANGTVITDDGTLTMSVKCLQDLMTCELSSSVGLTTTLNFDYDGDSAANGLDCATLLAPATLTTCSAVDTTH